MGFIEICDVKVVIGNLRCNSHLTDVKFKMCPACRNKSCFYIEDHPKDCEECEVCVDYKENIEFTNSIIGEEIELENEGILSPSEGRHVDRIMTQNAHATYVSDKTDGTHTTTVWVIEIKDDTIEDINQFFKDIECDFHFSPGAIGEISITITIDSDGG